MNKIKFENLPSKKTPLSAEVLNAMQENIEKAITNVFDNIKISKIEELFYDSTASYNSATLKDDITNYDMLIIIGQSSDGYQCSATMYKPYVGAKIGLVAPQITSNTTIYNKQAVFEFTSKKIIASIQNHQLQGNTSIASGNYIRLKSIIGIKLKSSFSSGEISSGGSNSQVS